jgi:hypothetical protein
MEVKGEGEGEGEGGGIATTWYEMRNLTNLVLDRILHNQLDNLNRPLLTQSMNPIHSLILNRRIPPRIHHEYHRRFGQVLLSAHVACTCVISLQERHHLLWGKWGRRWLRGCSWNVGLLHLVVEESYLLQVGRSGDQLQASGGGCHEDIH